MPLIKPKKSEKKNDFISRCMGDNTMGKDFKDQKQRAAVCYSQWKKAKASADVVLGSGNDEVLIINEAAQKYGGQKRSELKDSDFLFPETRSFPIVTPQDVRDAISNFGRMKGDMTYDEFIKKLYRKAKSKGQAFVDAIPESTKKEHKLSATDEEVAGCVKVEVEVEVSKSEMEEDESEGESENEMGEESNDSSEDNGNGMEKEESESENVSNDVSEDFIETFFPLINKS